MLTVLIALLMMFQTPETPVCGQDYYDGLADLDTQFTELQNAATEAESSSDFARAYTDLEDLIAELPEAPECLPDAAWVDEGLQIAYEYRLATVENLHDNNGTDYIVNSLRFSRIIGELRGYLYAQGVEITPRVPLSSEE
ncbi:MAG: hypothetical protein OHK0046_47800 [Anaerolineae bacterium]